MKQIFEFMENNSKKSMAMFLIFYLFLFVYEFISFYFALNQNRADSSHIYLAPFSWLILMVGYNLHALRFKKVVGNGSLNRIKLLPTNKMSFVYSELLYVGSTVVMLYVINYFAWFLSLMMTQNPSIIDSLLYSFSHLDILFYQSFLGKMGEVLPIYWLNILGTLVAITAITYACVNLIISVSESRYGVVFLYIITTLIILMTVISNESYSINQLVKISSYLMMIVYSHYSLYKRFGRRMKRT